MGAFWNGRRGRRYFAFPISDALPRFGNGPCSFPIGLPGLLAIELLAERSYGVNLAGAAFPSSAAFFELAGALVFSVATFALFSMSTIQLESHKTQPIVDQCCTLLHAGFSRFL